MGEGYYVLQQEELSGNQVIHTECMHFTLLRLQVVLGKRKNWSDVFHIKEAIDG